MPKLFLLKEKYLNDLFESSTILKNSGSIYTLFFNESRATNNLERNYKIIYDRNQQGFTREVSYRVESWLVEEQSYNYLVFVDQTEFCPRHCGLN